MLTLTLKAAAAAGIPDEDAAAKSMRIPPFYNYHECLSLEFEMGERPTATNGLGRGDPDAACADVVLEVMLNAGSGTSLHVCPLPEACHCIR